MKATCEGEERDWSYLYIRRMAETPRTCSELRNEGRRCETPATLRSLHVLQAVHRMPGFRNVCSLLDLGMHEV